MPWPRSSTAPPPRTDVRAGDCLALPRACAQSLSVNPSVAGTPCGLPKGDSFQDVALTCLPARVPAPDVFDGHQLRHEPHVERAQGNAVLVEHEREICGSAEGTDV
jgi:hypothetical protein